VLRCDTPFGIRRKGCQSLSNNRSKMDGFGLPQQAMRFGVNRIRLRVAAAAAVDVKRAADFYETGTDST
jgi:hypothetical protein